MHNGTGEGAVASGLAAGNVEVVARDREGVLSLSVLVDDHGRPIGNAGASFPPGAISSSAGPRE